MDSGIFTNIYSIPNNKIEIYAKRETKKKLNIMIIIFIIILLIFIGINNITGISILNIIPIILLFVILILILAVTINHNTKDLAKSTEFLLKDDKICKKIKQENLSTLNKIGAYRNEAKYGAKINQSINKKDILHTIIKDHEIEIEAIDSNIINGNGYIIIPEEIDGFDDIKQYILANSKEFRVLPKY